MMPSACVKKHVLKALKVDAKDTQMTRTHIDAKDTQMTRIHIDAKDTQMTHIVLFSFQRLVLT